MNGNELPICPLCGTPITEDDYTTQCPDCRVMYHEECWDANEGCATPECSQNHAEDEEYRRQSLNWAMPAGAPPAPEVPVQDITAPDMTAPEPPAADDDFPPLDAELYPQEENFGEQADPGLDIAQPQINGGDNYDNYDNYNNYNNYNEKINNDEHERVVVNLEKNTDEPKIDIDSYLSEITGENEHTADNIDNNIPDTQPTDYDFLNSGEHLDLSIPDPHGGSFDDYKIGEPAIAAEPAAEKIPEPQPEEPQSPNAIPQGGYFSNETVRKEGGENAAADANGADNEVVPLEYSQTPPQSGVGSLLRKTQRGEKAPISILRYPTGRRAAPPRQPSVTRLTSSLKREGADSKYLADVLDDIKDLQIPLHSSDAPMRPPRPGRPNRGARPARPRPQQNAAGAQMNPPRGTPAQAGSDAPSPAGGGARADAMPRTVHKKPKQERAGRPMQIRGNPVPKAEPKPILTDKRVVMIGLAAMVMLGALLVIITPPAAKNVSFRKDLCILAVDESTTVEYVIEPQRAAKRNLNWETTDKNVAVVNDGVIRGVGEGTCDITLSVGKKKAVEHVNIIPQVEDIILKESEIEMVVGEFTRPDYEVVPPKAGEAHTEMSVSDSTVVQAEGEKLRAVGEGDCIVTIAVGKKRANLVVHVVPAVTSFIVDDKTQSLSTGERVKVEYTITPKGAEGRKPEFTTSNKDVAVVENGEIVAVGSGSCEITALIDGFAQRISVTVKSSVKSLSLAPEAMSLYIGETSKITAKMNPPGESRTIDWSSSNESVATVDDDGVVTAVGEGTVRITARVDDLRETVDVNVRSERSKEAAKKIVGTWNGRYAYDSVTGKVKSLAGYETVLIAYSSGESTLMLSGSRYSGMWTYMEDGCYMFSLNGGATAIGQIQDISDVKNGLLIVFDDSDGSKMETSIVYQKTG